MLAPLDEGAYYKISPADRKAAFPAAARPRAAWRKFHLPLDMTAMASMVMLAGY
jgi:hypothetical protein